MYKVITTSRNGSHTVSSYTSYARAEEFADLANTFNDTDDVHVLNQHGDMLYYRYAEDCGMLRTAR